MNYRTLLLMILVLQSSLFAQESPDQSMQATDGDAKVSSKRVVADPNAKDAVVVQSVKFGDKKIAGERWVKASVKLRCIENPDAKDDGSNPDWLRNVEVRLICAFEDEKMSSSSQKKFVWLTSSAKIFAMKRNGDSTLNFYIPWEAREVYRIKDAPYGYLVEITANGREYPLTAKNISKRCNLKGSRVKSFVEAAEMNARANNGVMVPYEKAPFLLKYNDMPRSSSEHPTLVVE